MIKQGQLFKKRKSLHHINIWNLLKMWKKYWGYFAMEHKTEKEINPIWTENPLYSPIIPFKKKQQKSIHFLACSTSHLSLWNSERNCVPFNTWELFACWLTRAFNSCLCSLSFFCIIFSQSLYLNHEEPWRTAGVTHWVWLMAAGPRWWTLKNVAGRYFYCWNSLGFSAVPLAEALLNAE